MLKTISTILLIRLNLLSNMISKNKINSECDNESKSLFNFFSEK